MNPMGSVKNIRSWLAELDLEQHAAAFEALELDVADLPRLSEADLEGLGVVLFVHRKKILQAISRLLFAPPASADEALPSVIAIPLAEYRAADNPVIRLWNACDVVELTLRLVVAIGVADLESRGRLDKSLVRELRHHIEEPTLGRWKCMAQSVVCRLAALDAPVVPEVVSLVENGLVPLLDGTAGERRPETSFAALRNQLAHGGGVTRSVALQLQARWGGRLEALFSRLAFLREIALVTRVDGGIGVLRGPHTGTTPFETSAQVAEALVSVFERGDAVALVRDGVVLPLWPLAAYGVPRSGDPEMDPTRPTPQMYVRRGEVRLHFTPVGSTELCQSESQESALTAFMAFFRLDCVDEHAASKRFLIRGFEADIHRDAAKVVGRAEEIATVHASLRSATSGVLWISGHAGIGKSYVVARVGSELLQFAGDSLVLVYRFKAGDDRCSRHAFIQFAIERIEAWSAAAGRRGGPALPQQPMEVLVELLARIGERRIVFLLDGLDELAEKDSTFAEDLLARLQAPGVLWLCAGRPERGLPEAFAAGHCTAVFPDGMQPMGTGDVRTMLLEKIGSKRKLLLDKDKDLGNTVTNEFIERVATLAQGLPVYVTYVVGDILSNRFRVLDAIERLPPSLDDYHARLLRRCSIGRLSFVVTPLVALIAVAREPFSVEALTEILDRWIGIGAETDPVGLVRSCLASIASMIRRASTPERRNGYTLFHHSLREHMEKSDETRGVLASARGKLADLSTNLDPRLIHAEAYLHRHGVTHLVEAVRYGEARALLVDFASPTFAPRKR